MDNFSPAQYERFEAYRRHALPKQAVRKVIVYHLPILNSDRLFGIGHSTNIGTTGIPTGGADCRRFCKGIRWRDCGKRYLLRVCVLLVLKFNSFISARAVQERRGDKGPLSPDHLREAYRMYQVESGRVGSARPLRSKKLFVR